jgi:hypothetical protein
VWAFSDPDINVFDFLFLPDGTGCRIVDGPIYGGTPNLSRFEWVSTPDNRMDGIRKWLPDPSIEVARRSWEAATTIPGAIGDQYFVVENLEINSGLVPGYIFDDPTVTPGRMNNYEFIEDITGIFDPCGLGGPTSATTLFAQNNGGTGNMFDVSVNDAAVEITGIDVNVEYAAGTMFTIEVYTVPGSYADTITAPASCTFNCSFDVGAFTLVASGVGTAAGVDQPTFVDIDDFELDRNTTTGFWVTLVRDGSVVDEFRYTNIPPASQNYVFPALTITVGAGVTGQVGAEGIARNRAWNGTIYYNSR